MNVEECIISVIHLCSSLHTLCMSVGFKKYLNTGSWKLLTRWEISKVLDLETVDVLLLLLVLKAESKMFIMSTFDPVGMIFCLINTDL